MFKSFYNCSDCGHQFSKVTETDPRKKGGRPPACPKCRKDKYHTLKSIERSNSEQTSEQAEKNIKEICESRKAPTTGKSNFTKAMDETAKIVMQDYNMTNLQDNLRTGDSMAPKLQGKDASGVSLETRVDQVFSPQANKVMGMQNAGTLNNALMRQINSGAFKNQGGYNDVVAKSTVHRVPTKVMYEHNNKPD